jgi:hypothetical protein
VDEPAGVTLLRKMQDPRSWIVSDDGARFARLIPSIELYGTILEWFATPFQKRPL